jgi:hypothetical protein
MGTYKYLFILFFIFTKAQALVIVGDSTKKIDHHRPDFQATFTLKNETNTPNIIANISSSKSECYALYDKALILPKALTKIKLKCSLVSNYYQNTFLVSFNSNTKETQTLKLTVTGSSYFQEKECGDVDLDREGGSMEHVVVRNQKQTPFCMYNSLAQINDALRFSQGVNNYKNITSAEELALSYWKKENHQGVPTGLLMTPDNIFDLLMTRGSCFTNQLSKNIHANILGVISSIFREGDFKSYAASRYLPNKHFTYLHQKLKKLKVKPQNLLTLPLLKSYVSSQDYLGFVKYLLGDFTCPTKNLVPNNSYRVVSDMIYPSKHIKNYLTSDQSMPILAILSTDFFKYEFSKGIWPWQTNHAVLITGRRFNKNTGRCQIKIRNSWGKKSSYKNNMINVDKEHGSFWVNQSTLAKHLGQTYSIY